MKPGTFASRLMERLRPEPVSTTPDFADYGTAFARAHLLHSPGAGRCEASSDHQAVGSPADPPGPADAAGAASIERSSANAVP